MKKKSRNLLKKDLITPKYRQRIQKDKKKYSRKNQDINNTENND